ncbi:MAG TPA: T9SS type A sorting domain-containing protein, partial [Candidatus Cloacimonadota bacterium]|nr:T9SS type A sorting domain-containing protein [Candidatus Cloacimonadota bacterium]
LIINGGDHLLNPITNDFDPLMINGSYSMANEVTLSSLVTPGTTIQIMAIASMGEYTVTNIYNVVVGILLENFESGFGNFPWNFTGGDWITTPGGYEGNFAAQSAAIGHNQATGLSITMTNPADGIVSFWKKMSSEANRDFMKFYINNQLKGSWSGIDEIWTQVSYMVAAGTNTYRWEYMKDSSTSAGSDCVWVDEVVFPADDINTGSPILTIVQTNLDFGNSDIGGEVILPFSFSNTGDANMIGTLQIPSPYSLDEESDPPLRFMNYVLPAGESMDLNIAFRPTEEGVFAGYLIVVSDDPNASSVNIPLMGSATPVSNQDNHSPAVTALQGNYPNPFNPNTTVRFALKESAHVKIEVFNILGQKVKTLVNNQMNSGNHNVAWNGLDDNKRPVASGVYFYKMQSGDYSNTRKMILMK